MAPAEPASMVLTMIMLKRRSPADNVDTPLKPIHPKTKKMVPRIAIGM